MKRRCKHCESQSYAASLRHGRATWGCQHVNIGHVGCSGGPSNTLRALCWGRRPGHGGVDGFCVRLCRSNVELIKAPANFRCSGQLVPHCQTTLMDGPCASVVWSPPLPWVFLLRLQFLREGRAPTQEHRRTKTFLLKAPLPAPIPKREVDQLPVFQRGRFPSASAPHPSARLKGFSARPFSFLSPESAPDIHLPLSSDTPSWPLAAFFTSHSLSTTTLPFNTATCRANPWTAAHHGVQQHQPPRLQPGRTAHRRRSP